MDLSDARVGVLVQRWMRTLCANCSQAYKPDQKELDHLIDAYGREEFDELGLDTASLELRGTVGCDECGDSGYKGRTGIHELLVGTHEVQALIYRKAPLSKITEQAIKDGMKTMRQDGIAKVFSGITDYQQLLRVVGG